jgi:hypothetical protein
MGARRSDFHVISTYVFCWVSFIIPVALSIFLCMGRGGYLHLFSILVNYIVYPVVCVIWSAALWVYGPCHPYCYALGSDRSTRMGHFGLRVLSSLSNGLALISSFVSKFPIVDVVTCLNGYWIRLNWPLLLDNLNNSMGC